MQDNDDKRRSREQLRGPALYLLLCVVALGISALVTETVSMAEALIGALVVAALIYVLAFKSPR